MVNSRRGMKAPNSTSNTTKYVEMNGVSPAEGQSHQNAYASMHGKSGKHHTMQYLNPAPTGFKVPVLQRTDSNPSRQSNMTSDDLHQLKESLYKLSMCQSSVYDPNDGQKPGAAGFVNLNDAANFDGPGNRPHLSSAQAGLPRESAAVLVEAVRQSAIDDDEKTRFLFEIFDTDGNGRLSREGVMSFLESTMQEHSVSFLGEMNVQEVLDRVFANCRDPNHMTYKEFRSVFGETDKPREEAMSLMPGIAEKDARIASNELDSTGSDLNTMSSEDMQAVGKMAKKMKTLEEELAEEDDDVDMIKRKGPFAKLRKSYQKHGAQVWCLVIYFAVMVWVFAMKAMVIGVDPAVGWCPRIAKGFAQIIMVNTLFVLLPMCRNLMTTLRNFPVVSHYIPIDDHIEFHKICGIMMLIASLGHTAAWLMIVYYARTVPVEVWERSAYYERSFVRYQDLFSFAWQLPIWTGVLMVVIAIIAGIFTLPKLRQGKFNLFWLTHLLFIPFLILIVVHGLAQWVQAPEAYLWVVPPIIIYFLERRYRMRNVFGGKTQIVNAHVSAGTTALYFKRPKSFAKGQKFTPGMYMFINIPAISTYEWHPFTISSAPEDELLSLHIRKAGDWTGALHNLVEATERRQLQNPEGGNGHSDTIYPPIYIDGPVGAPAQDYSRYREVVLVGAGIGVTPFASILRSVVHQWRTFRCPDCSHMRFPPTFQLRKIYFFWVTREQESLTWFSQTMNQLAEMDTENRLEIHNYLSTIKRESIARPLQALQTFIHDDSGKDIVSGLETKQTTHFGRPNWKTELKRIALKTTRRRERLCAVPQEQNPHLAAEDDDFIDEIGVFYCGPKPLGNSLHDECAQFNHRSKRTKGKVEFDFHSENF